MKTRIFTLIMSLFIATMAFAYDAEIDGIYYDFDHENKTATVTSDGNSWDGNGAGYIQSEIVIPEKVTYNGEEYIVTSIGDAAFCRCSSLTSIEIPNSVTSIGNSAFYACYSLVDVYISDIAAWCNIDFDNYEGSNPLCHGGNLYLNGKGITELVLPEGIDSIKTCAFQGCNIKSVTIPNSVVCIGEQAFWDCAQLRCAKIGSGVKYIGENIFFCEEIYDEESDEWIYAVSFLDTLICEFGDDVELDFSEYSGERTEHPLVATKNLRYFQGPAKLVNSIKEEFQTQFSNKLTEVHITDGELDENGFNYINRSKKSLHTIDLAGTTNTAINDLAFYDCYKLENLMLPGNLETIGFKAFADCAQLKAIKFPSTLKAIQDLSFANCTKIDIMQVDAIIPPTITSTSFDKVSREIEFIVPEEARESYAQHEYWREFMVEKTEIENVVWNVEIYTRNGTLYIDVWGSDYQVFDVNGRLVYTGRDTQLSLPRGVYVVNVGGEVQKVVI